MGSIGENDFHKTCRLVKKGFSVKKIFIQGYFGNPFSTQKDRERKTETKVPLNREQLIGKLTSGNKKAIA